jgi:hypothetical protein
MSLVEAPFAGAWQLWQRVGMVESLRGAYAGCTVTWTRAGHAFGKKDPHAAGKTPQVGRDRGGDRRRIVRNHRSTWLHRFGYVPRVVWFRFVFRYVRGYIRRLRGSRPGTERPTVSLASFCGRSAPGVGTILLVPASQNSEISAAFTRLFMGNVSHRAVDERLCYNRPTVELRVHREFSPRRQREGSPCWRKDIWHVVSFMGSGRS